MKKLAVAAFALVLSACAAEQALIKPTTSGYPEGLFSNSTVADVRSKLVEGCMTRGVFVQQAEGNQVLCGKTMEGGQAVFAQMLMGNSYSTTPERKLRFVLFHVGSDVRVAAQQWVETQMALGQVRRTELNNNEHRNDIQQFLFSLGAR